MRRPAFFRVAAVVLAAAWVLAGCRGSSSLPGAADPPLDVRSAPHPETSVDVPATARTDVAGLSQVRIATWNVHFLWDDICDSGDCGPGDFEEVLSPAEMAARADEVAAAVRGLDADVVLLQEVETQRVLDAVLERLRPDSWAGHVGDVGYRGFMNTAVVARLTPVGVHTHRSDPIPLPEGGTTRFAREFLEIHFAAGDARLIVFCAHFRSKHDDDPDRRLAEAQAAYRIVTTAAEAHPGAVVVLGGDLNDVPGSAPLAALESPGGLLRVAAELGDGAATYWFDGPRALDHLFLATADGGGYVPGSARVLCDRPGWLSYRGSDHAALRAAFAFPFLPR